MTVTSKLHAQAEGAKIQKREEKATSSEGTGREKGPERRSADKGRPRPRARAADDLNAEGSGLRTARPREARMRQSSHSDASSKPQKI